jgi:hypothetical protein
MVGKRFLYLKKPLKMRMENARGLFSVKKHGHDPFFEERARAKPVPAFLEQSDTLFGRRGTDASTDPTDEHERTTDLDTQPQAI